MCFRHGVLAEANKELITIIIISFFLLLSARPKWSWYNRYIKAIFFTRQSGCDSVTPLKSCCRCININPLREQTRNNNSVLTATSGGGGSLYNRQSVSGGGGSGGSLLLSSPPSWNTFTRRAVYIFFLPGWHPEAAHVRPPKPLYRRR